MVAGTVLPADQEATESSALTLERILQIVLTAAQVALVALVVREFELESRGLYHTLLFAVAGFVLHAVLPARWRMACFAAVSVASIFLLFSLSGLWIVGLGLLLLGICVLPVPNRVRLGLLVALILLLAAGREDLLPVEVPKYIWPVIGGMFMFRLALIFQSVKHDGPPKDIWATLGYFFMIPNAAFPFFPIVDSKTFLRPHNDAPASAVYARGIAWMTRGIIHLVLYRLIYHYFVVDSDNLRRLSDVVQYCLQTYLLYLRVSGQFHLIVGLLHLFGFRLPETHHLYYLSDSFTELWRRINIYWKDFMMKVVYHPTFFGLRKLGNDRAILLSTAVVMVVTWALHGWQKFWIVGGNPFTWPDTLFWLVLGGLVVISAAVDLAKAKRREAPKKGYDFRRGLRTAGVFFTIAILFTLWTSDTVGNFFNILLIARNVDRSGVLMLGGLTGLLVVVGGWNWGATDIRQLKMQPLSLGGTARKGMLNVAVLGGLALLVQPEVKFNFGSKVADVLTRIASNRLNQRDQNNLTVGYYEALARPNRLAGQLWDVEQDKPRDWFGVGRTEVWGVRNDFLVNELVPSRSITIKRQEFATNSHGLHDQEYSTVKPEGTYRIAVLGASPVMAPGVAQQETFEAILERRLDSLARPLGRRVEVLNFGVAGYSVLQQMLQLEDKVLALQPDLVIVTSIPPDRGSIGIHVKKALTLKIPIPYPDVQAVVEREHLNGNSTVQTILRAMGPLADSLMILSVTRSDSLVRSRGVKAAMMVMRLPSLLPTDDRLVQQQAAALGWPVMDLTDIYAPNRDADYALPDYDQHWNALGHQLVAGAMEARMRAIARQLGLPPLWGDTSAPQATR